MGPEISSRGVLKICALTSNDKILGAVQEASSAVNCRVQLLMPQSIDQLRELTEEGAVDLAITLLPEGWLTGQSLSRELPVYSLSYPSLVAFTTERDANHLQQPLRAAGVVDLDYQPHALSVFRRILGGGLQGSDSSIMQKLNQSARMTGPRMFAVTTREGDHGRIYVNDGLFIEAEFKGIRGIEALSALLCIDHARVVHHEGGLAVEGGGSSERVADAISEAMDLLEESGKGFRMGGISGTMYILRIPVVGVFGEGRRVPDMVPPEEPADVTAPVEPPSQESVPGVEASTIESEKVVSAKNWSDGMGASLEEFLTKLPQISGMAEADLDGIVVKSVGAADHDTACAVASVITGQLQRIAGCLDLGEPRCWALSGSDNSVFVGGAGNRMYVGSGPSLKNVGPLMVKLFAV